MTPPTTVEFSPPRLQRLYSDMPEVFSKEIARRKMQAANVNVPSSLPHHPNQTPHVLSPSNATHPKRNRPDDVSDTSANKRRDVGDGKIHASSLSPSSVSPNPMMPGSTGMPSIPVSGPGHGPPGNPSSGMNSNPFLASGMGTTGSTGLRASPDTFSGPMGVAGMTAPGTPHIPQSPTVSASSNTGIPHPPPVSLPSAGMPGMNAGGMSGMQSNTGTAAIPSSAPGAPPNVSFGTGDPMVANMRRMQLQQQQIREQQIRQQQQQHAGQMQQMQQAQGGTAASRHMSPPASAQAIQGGIAAGGGGPGVPSNQPQQPGPAQQAQIHQLVQVLQNPSHPVMMYITQNVPNFSALPVQQQLQRLQAFQSMLTQRSQHRNPQMSGMQPNAGLPSGLSNGTMTGGNGNNGGASPVSPLGQQAPAMSQPQQITSQQASQNGMFPFVQPHSNGGGSGMDPRMAVAAGGSNFSQQMPGNMSNVNINQQRQLMLMQQQQHQQQQMRNMNGNLNMGGGVGAAGMMGSQQHGTFGMNPRMMGQLGGSSQQQQPQPPQAPGATGGGSSMVPTNDTFPALRSNSAIPGIARSTRSPSDGVHSPMTPRAPSRLSHQQTPNDYQAILQQQHAQSAFNQGGAWSQGAQTPMGGGMGGLGQVNGYAMGGSMNSPNGIGGAFFGGSPSPSNQTWHGGGGGMAGVAGYGYGHGQSTMGGGQRPPDQTRPQMGGGGTPVPQAGGGSAPPSATQNMSPIGPDMTGNGDYDIFNPYVNGQ
ncbi:hypothetical protein EDC04DRAFT_1478573 [Pisolithus marmoratus]|nr:hypothetical protein EDC04DRAFT_1478573 [Pisolithus marmoratus]